MPEKTDRRRPVLGSLVPQVSINNFDIWKGGLPLTDYYTSSALEKPQQQQQEDAIRSQFTFESNEHLELENAMKNVQLKLREQQDALFAIEIQRRSQRIKTPILPLNHSLPLAPSPAPISSPVPASTSDTNALQSRISSNTSRSDFLLNKLVSIEKLLQKAGQGFVDPSRSSDLISPSSPNFDTTTMKSTTGTTGSQLKESNACYAKALEHLRLTVEELGNRETKL